jgi:CheY-like chemotaxis protein
VNALRILAVDDNALVLMNTVMMLQDMGHEVLEAISGTEALNVMTMNGSRDLIVTDQNMPSVTGVKLAEAVKSKWPRTKVIIATGYAELPPGESSGHPRLGKPFTQQELVSLVTTVAREMKRTGTPAPL